MIIIIIIIVLTHHELLFWVETKPHESSIENQNQDPQEVAIM